MRPSGLHPSRWSSDLVIAIVVGALVLAVVLYDPAFFPEGFRAWRVPLSAAVAVGVGWLVYKVNRDDER